jgi:hypothetical protein
VTVSPAAGAPELPRLSVDTRYPQGATRTLLVRAGGNLQAALDSARYGDVVALEPGATFTGNFVLRAKSGTGWIVIRSAASDASLPAEGTRLTPASAAQMPKILSPNVAPAIATDPGAHHYRLVALDIGLSSAAPYSYGLVALGSAGSDQNALSQVPSYLVIDRSWVHGTPTQSIRRCVALNSAHSAVVDSYLDDCHGRGQDTQAIAGWNGPGPYKINNNYLAGAGENVMFGGADPHIPNLVPSDIEFRRNAVIKPAAWKGVWTVKNSFELKNARRVLVDANLFDGSWHDAQTGPAIVIKSANQDGACNWCVSEHVTFTNNRVRNVGAGFVINGTEAYSGGSAVPVNNVRIANNVLEQMNVGVYSGVNRTIQVGGLPSNIVFEHNTLSTPNAAQLMWVGSLGTGFRFVNNIAHHGQYGVITDGKTNVVDVLNTVAPSGWTFAGNAVVGTDGRTYPAANTYPASESAASTLRAADGAPLGADATKLP